MDAAGHYERDTEPWPLPKPFYLMSFIILFMQVRLFEIKHILFKCKRAAIRLIKS
jgi:hypothetical protein